MEAYRLYTYQTTKRHYQPPQQQPKMSDITLADLTYISREDLSATLLSSSATATTTPLTPEQPHPSTSNSSPLPANLAIIDVRDNDHIGGHINGSTWVPSSTLDYRIPELVRTLADKEMVVFHCALSQQRGPSAALRYLREKSRLEGKSEEEVVQKGEGEKEEVENGEEKKGDKKEQKVLVLDGGFVKWQEKYGADKRLTKAWKKDVWEFGY
jgi:Cdc25 family phosphatase